MHLGEFHPAPLYELHPTVYTPFPNACPVTVTVGTVAVASVVHPIDSEGNTLGPATPGVKGTPCDGLVEALEGENVPAGQGMHEASWMPLYCPAGHAVQDVLPATEENPAGQLWHTLLLFAPMVPENVPAGHWVHEAELLAPGWAE